MLQYQKCPITASCQVRFWSRHSASRFEISETLWQPGQQPATQQHSNCDTMKQHRDVATQQLRPLHRDLEASLPLLDVLLRMENDDVDFGHVEHPKRHRCTERHGNSQSGCLDEHLWRQRQRLSTRASSRAFLLGQLLSNRFS